MGRAWGYKSIITRAGLVGIGREKWPGRVFAGTLAGFDNASYTNPDNFTFYLVDGTQSVMIETDNTQLTLGYLELQQ
jgi:hypothetical protein